MPEPARNSTSAAQALVMATILDASRVSAAQKSLCNKELRETMAGLRALAAARPESDGIDELAAERDRRRSA